MSAEPLLAVRALVKHFAANRGLFERSGATVKAVDANLMLEGLQKIANRITSGVILAALIIGASLLMRVETSFVLFGYPGIAIICFLGAVAGGIYMVVNIVIQDQRSQRAAAKQRRQHL